MSTTTETKLFRAQVSVPMCGTILEADGVATELEDGRFEFLPDFRLLSRMFVDACDIKRIG